MEFPKTESFRLRVKLGGLALKLNNVAFPKYNDNAVQGAILRAQEALARARLAHSPQGEKKCSYEEEAIRFAMRKRAGMEHYYGSEDIFHKCQENRITIINEEAAARQRLMDLHQKLRKEAAKRWTEQYLASPACVHKRFALAERCFDEKVKMVQECSDYLLSVKFAEEEARNAFAQQARRRQVEEVPFFPAPQYTSPPQRMPAPQQSTPAPLGQCPAGHGARPPTAHGGRLYPLPHGYSEAQGAFQQPQGAFQQPQGAFQQPQGAFQQPQGAFQQPQGPFQQPQGAFQRPQYNPYTNHGGNGYQPL